MNDTFAFLARTYQSERTYISSWHSKIFIMKMIDHFKLNSSFLSSLQFQFNQGKIAAPLMCSSSITQVTVVETSPNFLLFIFSTQRKGYLDIYLSFKLCYKKMAPNPLLLIRRICIITTALIIQGSSFSFNPLRGISTKLVHNTHIATNNHKVQPIVRTLPLYSPLQNTLNVNIESKGSSKLFNVANILTLSRVVAIPFFMLSFVLNKVRDTETQYGLE
jgi:hypothetical protein